MFEIGILPFFILFLPFGVEVAVSASVLSFSVVKVKVLFEFLLSI
jgi:hypothetical protein